MSFRICPLVKRYICYNLHVIFFLYIDPIVMKTMTPEEIKLCDGEWSNNWQISKFAALGTLCLLTLWELMQLTTKIVNGQFQEFFGWQNMIEGVMISLTFTFYLVEHLEYDHSKLFYSYFIIKFSSSYLISIFFQQLQTTF